MVYLLGYKIIYQEVFGTQLFLFLFNFVFGEIGYLGLYWRQLQRGTLICLLGYTIIFLSTKKRVFGSQLFSYFFLIGEIGNEKASGEIIL